LAVAGAIRLLAGFAIACGTMLVFTQADAGWWSRAPTDFEECALSAEKNAASPEDKDKRLTACEAQFAGRRKPGGGYTYYDFMQNRHFDIAGPNPTVDEQKYIDEQYTVYLKDQRRSIIAAAFFQKQQEVEHAKAMATLGARGNEKASSGDIKLAVPKTTAKRVVMLPRPRPKIAPRCEDDIFATCGWSRFSRGVRNLKKALFASTPAKMSATRAHGAHSR
jgi:hypothetical protein